MIALTEALLAFLTASTFEFDLAVVVLVVTLTVAVLAVALVVVAALVEVVLVATLLEEDADLCVEEAFVP